MESMSPLEIAWAVALGLGLAAACGFRVFVPPLVLALAAKFGHADVGADFAWVTTWPAITALGVATLLEISAYYIPWIDNLLDTVAGPAAVVAGIGVSAAAIGDIAPEIKWPLAVIAGGAGAGLTHVGTAAIRAVSTATTGGVANPIFSTLETGLATGLAALAILLPLLVIVALAVVAWLGWRWLQRRRLGAESAQTAAPVARSNAAG